MMHQKKHYNFNYSKFRVLIRDISRKHTHELKPLSGKDYSGLIRW